MTETSPMIRIGFVAKAVGGFFVAVVLVVLIAFFYPPSTGSRDGRFAAEADWYHGAATVVDVKPTSIKDGDLAFSWGDHDLESGLGTSPDLGTRRSTDSSRYAYEKAYDRAYGRRVRELLKADGVPSWSMKKHLVSKEILAEMFTTNELRPATEFPFKIDKRYTLETEKSPEPSRSPDYFFVTTGSRRGNTKSDANEPGAAKSQHKGGFPFLIGMPLLVGMHADYPDTVFIRQGNSWLVAIYRGTTVVGRVGRRVELAM